MYRKSVELSSTYGSYVADNAIDSNYETSALTKSDMRPWFAITWITKVNVSIIRIWMDIEKVDQHDLPDGMKPDNLILEYLYIYEDINAASWLPCKTLAWNLSMKYFELNCTKYNITGIRLRRESPGVLLLNEIYINGIANGETI
jgi:hypothetical protein